MRTFVIAVGLLLFINTLNASPIIVSLESDESSSSDEDGIVYVLNLYAVRRSTVPKVARILNQKSIEKLPTFFEPIGTLLVADEESYEPFTMEQIKEFLDDEYLTVTKVDIGKDSNIYELQLGMQDEYESENFVAIFDELFKYLDEEGILIKMSIEGNKKVIEVKFDDSVKISDYLFSLEEFAEFFENEGITVETVKVHDEIRAVRLIFELPQTPNSEKTDRHNKEVSTTQRIDDRINEIEKKDDKLNEVANSQEKKSNKIPESKIEKNYIDKKEKYEPIEDQFLVHDFITRADSINKIRRRRSVCPECKINDLIKEFATKFEKEK
ncbi:uncharacterized protein [Chelonus insularis]|uniref:uncharacterized protein n=1 Tax=Chelonus insularis TaxID=460826 RepID=UPI00158C064A|nr:uncharacterized protein LOC118064396 [Chelonus insularis]XP_034934841.1 uncharacterized protein LOC118064396 [Chelonus insularis]